MPCFQSLFFALLPFIALAPTVAQPPTLAGFIPDLSLNRTSIIATLNQVPLTRSEKLRIIDAARSTIRSLNVHKNVIKNIHKADPVAELKLLRRDPPSPNHRFHNAMRRVFERLNDFHTTYRRPPPINSLAAILPLSIRIFYTDPPNRRYVVTKIFDRDSFPTKSSFNVGVEVVSFNGLPIDQAVKKMGRRSHGANPAARISRAEHLLTARAISIEPIPDKDTAVIGYKTPAGRVEEVVSPWLFGRLEDPGLLSILTRQGLDWPHDREAYEIHNSLRAAQTMQLSKLDLSSVRIPPGERQAIVVNPMFLPLFFAEVVATKSGLIGHLILPSFGARAIPELIAELSRVLKLMPSSGLVIDIRANLGGFPDYAKALTELYSDIPIPPQGLSGRVSNLFAKAFTSKGGNRTTEDILFTDMFRSAVRTGLRAGEKFTGPVGNIFAAGLEKPFPKSKRVYFGPVITLTDGRTYSAGDIFAALQVDQGHSLVVGVSDNTGAGGAQATRYRDFARMFPDLFKPLPQSVDFSISTARCFRTGKRSGTMIEVFGVKPQIRYYETYDDRVKGECDMFEFLGRKLASMSKKKRGEHM